RGTRGEISRGPHRARAIRQPHVARQVLRVPPDETHPGPVAGRRSAGTGAPMCEVEREDDPECRPRMDDVDPALAVLRLHALLRCDKRADRDDGHSPGLVADARTSRSDQRRTTGAWWRLCGGPTPVRACGAM